MVKTVTIAHKDGHKAVVLEESVQAYLDAGWKVVKESGPENASEKK